MQDIAVADQPMGYEWHAPLPAGVANISTRVYWQPEEPAMLGNEPTQSPQKPRRVIIEDCPSPIPTLAIDAGTRSSTTMGTQTGEQDE
eukprot:7114445-Pyramimonas_sp.AAC.1